MNKENSYAYFCNRDCKYYPCHAGVNPDSFNCLFCYCPLYMLDDACGGNFSYTEKGVKDCSACLIPHSVGGYDYVTERFRRIANQMAENRRKNLEGAP
ncbi:cysteine-rich small domain-containing protein [Butyricicoccus sp. Marseille-Q5471]|uniref:cysteine-rich small domain-containing protein n=1 Tax=Butyricicoccus sp. Marseille-Q5471 TaxID=3039493 RepID=UPI0024BC5598|nr:cysteine-rich small domain-containing protein [Butyricicoccus sp. Marseille-Q5471]